MGFLSDTPLPTLTVDAAKQAFHEELSEALSNVRTIVTRHQMAGNRPDARAAIAGFIVEEQPDGSLTFTLPAELRR